MRLNRKSVTWGLAGLALAAALVGGAGVAVAASGTTSAVASTVSSADPPYGHMGDMGDANGMAGMVFGENWPLAAAAAYLGLSRDDLLAQLRGGQSLAAVAAAQGKSVSGLEDAMMTAMTTTLDANTTLTAPEKAVARALMKSHLDAMVTATRSSGAGFGPLGEGMGGMMGR